MNIFLERLKDELSYQGLTQKELADKTEISVNTIRGWFSKDLVPDVFNAVKAAFINKLIIFKFLLNKISIII